MVCPRAASPLHPPSSQPGAQGPCLLSTWSPTPNPLPRPELRPWVRGPGPLPGTCELGDTRHPLHQPTASPALSRSTSSSKTPPTQLERMVCTRVLSAPGLTSVRDHLLPGQGPPVWGGGPSCWVPESSTGLGRRPREGCREAPEHRTCSDTPPASGWTESLPSPHLLPCTPTTSPDPEDSASRPSAQP